MTTYRTKYYASVREHIHYVCPSCGKETEHYHNLYHPSPETGGFCPCCKGDVDEWSHYTVYARVYARSAEEALDSALDLGMFEAMDKTIELEERVDDKHTIS